MSINLTLWSNLLLPTGFGKFCFQFHFSWVIFWFLDLFLLWLFGYLVTCCLVFICLFFSHFSLYSWFLIFYHCDWKTVWYNFYPNKLVRLVLWTSIWSLWENISWTLENNCIFCKFWMSISYRCQLNQAGLLCHLRTLLLYWFLSGWSIHLCMWHVTIPYINALLSISFMFVNICFIYLGAPYCMHICNKCDTLFF